MSKDIQVKRTQPESLDIFSNMDHIVDRMFSESFSPLFGSALSTARPVSDIKETNEAYVLSSELPGIPKEDIDVEVNGNVLTIRAEHSRTKDKKGTHRESYQSYQQTFTLPTTVDAELVEAHCENGILEVMMPKKNLGEARKVAVETGKGSLWDRLTNKKPSAPEKKNVN